MSETLFKISKQQSDHRTGRPVSDGQSGILPLAAIFLSVCAS